jgi:membrane protease YdiL (CAAX protease family)
MEDDLLVAEYRDVESSAPVVHDVQQQMDRSAAATIAPWWHTVAVLLLLLCWTAMGARRGHATTSDVRLLTYAGTIMMTWMLFGSTVAGIRDRGSFFTATLLHRAGSFGKDFRRGVAVYVGIYAVAIAVAFSVIVTTEAYHAYRGSRPALATQASRQEQTTRDSSSQASGQSAPAAPPAPADPLPGLSRWRVDSEKVRAIAPHTWTEMLVWIGLSCTAGFCEEHVFRGYLLTQALAWCGRAGLPRLWRVTLSIAITSTIFGGLHLYEGAGGAALIAALGAVYCLVALKLGNLRAVIVAHFLQDFIAGLVLFSLHLHHTR